MQSTEACRPYNASTTKGGSPSLPPSLPPPRTCNRTRWPLIILAVSLPALTVRSPSTHLPTSTVPFSAEMSISTPSLFVSCVYLVRVSEYVRNITHMMPPLP